MDVLFEPVTDSHLELLADWLQRPHWREWWGDPDTELSYIRDMVEGRDTSRPFVFFVDGQATGYIQYWFIGEHQSEQWTADNPWLAELPSDAIGVDLSIAHPEMLSQGIGSHVLETFVNGLMRDGWQTIIIDPDPANKRAVRAYEKAGFKTMPELSDKARDCIIMRFEPDNSEHN